MKIDISAPGKVILHGEHAVVYGKAAIAVSLSLRTKLALKSPNEDKVTLQLIDFNVTKEWDVNDLNDCSISCAGFGEGTVIPADEECIKLITDKFVLNDLAGAEKQAMIAFLYLWLHISKSYNIGTFPSCHIAVNSDLSIGSGMGSSASFSVCISAAILILCGRITPSLLSEDKHLINKWAFQAERIFHGNPSGIDNSICTYGGALLFENGKVSDSIPELENIDIFLVDTHVSRNTKDIVSDVKKKQQLYPSVIDPILESISSISHECWKLLKSLNDPEDINIKKKSLEDFVVMNHLLLNCIDAGHEKLTKIFRVAQKNSCAAKITGAGGGGCAFVLLPSGTDGEISCDVQKLKRELEFYKNTVWQLHLGQTGVQVKFENTVN